MGVMSDVYTGHFALVARQGDTNKAFAVLERARGRALADLMRSSSGVAATNNAQRDRAISQLQVRLLRASSPGERRRILSQLWDTEQSIGGSGSTNAKRSTTADESMALPSLQRRLTDGETDCLRSNRADLVLPRNRQKLRQPRRAGVSQAVNARPTASFRSFEPAGQMQHALT